MKTEHKEIELSGSVYNFYKALSVNSIQKEVMSEINKLAVKAAKEIVDSYDVDTLFSKGSDLLGDTLLITVVMKRKDKK